MNCQQIIPLLCLAFLAQHAISGPINRVTMDSTLVSPLEKGLLPRDHNVTEQAHKLAKFVSRDTQAGSTKASKPIPIGKIASSQEQGSDIRELSCNRSWQWYDVMQAALVTFIMVFILLLLWVCIVFCISGTFNLPASHKHGLRAIGFKNRNQRVDEPKKPQQGASHVSSSQAPVDGSSIVKRDGKGDAVLDISTDESTINAIIAFTQFVTKSKEGKQMVASMATTRS